MKIWISYPRRISWKRRTGDILAEQTDEGAELR